MKSILIKSPLVFCALINLRLTKNHWENLDCVHYLNHTKSEYKGRVEFENTISNKNTNYDLTEYPF